MPAKRKTTVAKRRTARDGGEGLNFTALVASIRQVHEQSAALVNRTVNITPRAVGLTAGYLATQDPQGRQIP